MDYYFLRGGFGSYHKNIPAQLDPKKLFVAQKKIAHPFLKKGNYHNNKKIAQPPPTLSQK